MTSSVFFAARKCQNFQKFPIGKVEEENLHIFELLDEFK